MWRSIKRRIFAATVHGNRQSTPSADDADLVLIVAQAREGVAAAWEALIGRFGGLVAAIARRCRLSDADVAEVCQTTWLRLVENLDRIEQPERLGAWLATTSRRESLRIATRQVVVSANELVYFIADDKADPLDAALLREEQERAIRMAAEQLSPRCQRLLGLLMGDDDLPYKEIAEQLSMPIGSIGPTRGRCLDHLRADTGRDGGSGRWIGTRVDRTSFLHALRNETRTAGRHASRGRLSASSSPQCFSIHPSAPGVFDLGKGPPDLGEQVRYEQENVVRTVRVSMAGLTMGMSVPGMRSPCFAVDVSTIAGKSRRST